MQNVQQTVLGESPGTGQVYMAGNQRAHAHLPSRLYELNADWHGTYLTNDGQIVKTEDAFLLAAALEKSLEHISDANNKIDWNLLIRTG